MAENDIYNSRGRYKRVTQELDSWVAPAVRGKRRYWIKNPNNLQYFHKLARKYEAQDLSYIRRVRMIRTLLMISYVLTKDFKEVGREDIDELMAFAHSVNHTVESKKMFASNLKTIWKNILPDNDEYGRPDETKTPYVVRHVKVEQDCSREKIRKDKQTPEEVKATMAAFFDRPDLQCAMWLAYEGLARPQEILSRKISDVERHAGYAKIWISEHGKEGVGFIPVMEGFEALEKWLKIHPFANDPNAPLFPGRKNMSLRKSIRIESVNKFMRLRLRAADLNERVTMYSFKRNGITHMRLAGCSDNEIQRRARWKSTKQLHRYDQGTQEDAFKVELQRRGLIRVNEVPAVVKKSPQPIASYCTQCGKAVGQGARFCGSCGSSITHYLDTVAKRPVPDSSFSVT